MEGPEMHSLPSTLRERIVEHVFAVGPACVSLVCHPFGLITLGRRRRVRRGISLHRSLKCRG